jgi:hypothetical protein
VLQVVAHAAAGAHARASHDDGLAMNVIYRNRRSFPSTTACTCAWLTDYALAHPGHVCLAHHIEVDPSTQYLNLMDEIMKVLFIRGRKLQSAAQAGRQD